MRKKRRTARIKVHDKVYVRRARQVVHVGYDNDFRSILLKQMTTQCGVPPDLEFKHLERMLQKTHDPLCYVFNNSSSMKPFRDGLQSFWDSIPYEVVQNSRYTLETFKRSLMRAFIFTEVAKEGFKEGAERKLFFAEAPEFEPIVMQEPLRVIGRRVVVTGKYSGSCWDDVPASLSNTKTHVLFDLRRADYMYEENHCWFLESDLLSEAEFDKMRKVTDRLVNSA